MEKSSKILWLTFIIVILAMFVYFCCIYVQIDKAGKQLKEIQNTMDTYNEQYEQLHNTVVKEIEESNTNEVIMTFSTEEN